MTFAKHARRERLYRRLRRRARFWRWVIGILLAAALVAGIAATAWGAA